ncbi:MAG TPA: S41 family peptidase [Puia sp.]|nr:S41 family peptidase [Puia sp.]
MPKSILPLLLLSLLCSSEQAAASAGPDSLPVPCREKAEQLLDQALGFMEKNYYRRQEVDWTTLAAHARQQLQYADNCDDAYASISWCFRQLGERHSFIMPPDKAARYTGEGSAGTGGGLPDVVGEIRGEWLTDSIGYLTIPWVSTTDSLLCERIADSVQSVIAHLDTRRLSRWIIDLRHNTGGNCWPMLAGIGPLLGDGIYGYFVASGEKIPFSYYDGSAFQGKRVLCRVSNRHGYHASSGHNSIVVLTGNRTVSAGEIVALAFKGREHVRLIGQPTAGLTTANATYSLSDRSMLVLTVCQEADCVGRICDGRIQPDEYISAGNTVTDADPARAAAIAWLENE